MGDACKILCQVIAALFFKQVALFLPVMLLERNPDATAFLLVLAQAIPTEAGTASA